MTAFVLPLKRYYIMHLESMQPRKVVYIVKIKNPKENDCCSLPMFLVNSYSCPTLDKQRSL